MAKASETAQVSASPEEVWAAVGDPAGLAGWHPAIESSVVDGESRLVILGDGAEVKERITAHSDEDRSYSYDIVDSPLPILGCSSRLAVEPSGDGAAVTWEGVFEAKGVPENEAIELLSGFYRAGVDAAAAKFG